MDRKTTSLEEENRRALEEIGRLKNELETLKRDHGDALIYKNAVEALELGVVVSDPNLPGNPLVACNEAFLKLTGYSKEEIVGKNCRFLQRDDRDQEELEKVRVAVRDGTRCEVLLRNYRSDGTLFWNNLLIKPVHDIDGRIVNCVGTITDVTDKIEAGELLSDNLQWSQALFQQAPKAILLVSGEGEDEGRILLANPVAEEIYGCETGELSGMHVEEISVLENFYGDEATRAHLKNGERVKIRGRHKRFDGSVFPVEVFASRIDHGGVQCVLAFVSDIATREKLEEEVRLSAERSELALQVLNDGFFDLNVKTGEVHFDKRYYTMAGYEPGEFPGQIEEWAARVHPDDYGDLQPIVSKYLSGKEHVYDQQFRFQRNDGKWMWIRARAMVASIDEDGAPLRVVGTHRDITHRLAAEEKLLKLNEELTQSRDEARSSNQAKDDFLSVMSHELRTPLNPIVGFLEVLKDHDLSPETRELLGFVEDGADRMLHLVNSILMYVDVGSGRSMMVRDTIDYRKVCREALDRFRDQANVKSLEVEFVDDGRLESIITTDREKFETILKNILSNAFKFTENGFVRLVCVLRNENDGSNLLEIRVKDSGIGISEENRWKVFDPFTQIDSSLTRGYGGIGLGLPLVKKFVEHLGGQIDFETVEGEGTEFIVRLPVGVVAKDRPRQGKPGRGILGIRRKKVLLVDDDVVSLKLAQIYFELSDCEVVLANDGEEALQHSSSASFDLVLMDLKMPGMDGFEVTRRIREGASLNCDTLILAASAQVEDDAYERCMKSGMNGYISKPYTPVRLKEKLSELF